MVAAPSYLRTRAPVLTPGDLRTCDFISFAMLPDEVTLTRRGEIVVFTPERIRLEVDAVDAAKLAILSGLGLRNLPASEVEIELAQGSLVEVLPQCCAPVLGVFAVWPDNGPQKKLTRRLIDYLVAKAGA